MRAELIPRNHESFLNLEDIIQNFDADFSYAIKAPWLHSISPNDSQPSLD